MLEIQKCFVFLVGAASIIHRFCEATGTTLKNNRYQDINDEIKLDPPMLSDFMILYNYTTLEAATETTGNVSVHSTANRDVIFSLTIEGYADCEVSLHSPDGRSFKKAAHLRHVDFAFNTAEVGTWTYSVTCSRLERLSVVVKSRAPTADDNFTITSSPGALEVKNFTPEDDHFILQRVTDLNVTNINETEGLVTFSWTAPGSDTGQGNVSATRYDLRFCQNKEVAVQNFYDDCKRVPLDKVIVGTLHPHIAGSKETYIISVEVNTSSVVLVMKVFYNTGQWSDVSNPVVVTFQPITTMGHSTTTLTSPTSSTSSRTSPTTSKTPTTTPSSTTTASTTTSSTSTTTPPSATTSTHTSTTTTTSSAPPSQNQTSSLTSTPSSTTTKIPTPTSTTTTTTTPSSTPTPVITSTTVVDTTTATTPAKHRITTVTVSFTKIVHTSPTVSLSTSEKRTIFIASTVGGIAALAIFIAVVILVLKMRNRVCTKKDKYHTGKRARNMQNIDRMDLVSETRELNSLSPSGRYLK